MESSNMLPCDDLREHLEGHESQLLRENEIKNEQDSDQYSDAGSLILDCVKEEEQLQGQNEGTQGEVKFDESSLVPSKSVVKRRTLHERKLSSGTFMCSKCSFKSINKIIFNEHMNRMHLNKHKCDHCPNRFSSEGRLAYHIRQVHMNLHMKDEDKPKLPEDEFFRITKKKQGNRKTLYECLKCTHKTPSRSYIYLHIRTVHRELLDELYKSKGMVLDDAAYHKCTKCFFKTLNIRDLKRHIKSVHHKTRDFVCDLCKKNFTDKSHLLQHMKNIHMSAESLELHKCSICAYKTIHKNDLKIHLNVVHLKIRRYTCDLCQMKLSTRTHLRLHIEKHHLEKNNISCNRDRDCSFKTTEKRELLKHIQRVHENIQGLSCELCGKWYSSRTGLINHKNDHITNRLTCDLCQATTKTRDNMYKHMKLKHL